MRSGIKRLPEPRWVLTAWLTAPAHVLTPAVAEELRQSMFRRLEAVVLSGVMTLCIALIAVCRHPKIAFEIWLVLDLTIFAFRVSLVVHVWGRQKQNNIGCLFGPRITDLYVLCGTLWCAFWGFGEGIIMMSGDEPLMMTATLAGSAILGALCIRNPSSPRQNTVQMSLILIPFSIGCFLGSTPIVSWFILLGPIYLWTLSDMTRQIHDDYVAMIVAQFENRDRALHCPLTGLPNRRYFDEGLHVALGETQASKQKLAVLCIDLDGFKGVNDRFGHAVGDALLVEVAERLNRLMRARDVVARLGGDEFAVLMPNTERHDAERLAEHINESIALPFDLGPHVTVRIGASVGIFVSDSEPGSALVNASLVMAHADEALYAAKRAGKGRFR